MIIVTCGDSKYYETMMLNVQQVRRLHPSARVVVGDLGLVASQVKHFKSKQCEVLNLKAPWNKQDRGYKMQCKPLLILWVLMLYNETVLFMDGDAILVREFDLQLTGDAIVTTRTSKYGRINSGVVVTNSVRFVTEWLHKSISGFWATEDDLSEQNGLIELCDNYFPFKFRVQEVPCRQYNYSAVENGIPEDVRIVHLKSGRHKVPDMIKTVEGVCDI